MIGQPGFLISNKIIQIDAVKKFKDKPFCNEISDNDEDSDEYATIIQKMAMNYTNCVWVNRGKDFKKW